VSVLARVFRAFERPRTVLHVSRSAGNLLIVSEDDEGRRYLQFGWDGASQSVVWPGFPLRLELAYTRAVVAGLAFVPELRRILVVGVGGGAIPMFLRAVLPQAHVDAVDLNPGVLEVARRYFGFREDALLHAHVADGRRFIEAPGAPYDVIILDAYGARGIPSPLATQEFLQAAQARLTRGGAVVSNVWRAPNKLFPVMVRTWQASFAQLYAFDVEETANRVLVGLAHAEKRSRRMLKARADQLTRGQGVSFSLRSLVARPCEAPPGREVPEPGEDVASPPVLRDRTGG
jgi:spermidine synthase